MTDTPMTTHEVAAALGVNRKTVQRLVHRGALVPDVTTRNGHLFSPATVQAFQAERAEPAVATS